jgi:stearoyl-CoA desaturase (delta-9 desaturase)
VLVALLSMGEGYHNFHHTFPSDYRNGVRAWHFDPTKWILWLLSKVGVVRNLRRTSVAAIFRARLAMDQRRLDACPLPPVEHERLRALRASIQGTLDRLHELASSWETTRREASEQARQMGARLQAEMRLARRELGQAYASWQRAVSAWVALGQPRNV